MGGRRADDASVPAVRIPHRPPLRLLADSYVRVGDWLLVAATVPADGPAAADGAVRPGYLIEIAAQAAAAWAGADDAAGAGADGGRGLLVGVRDWRWLAPAPADAVLAVRARRVAVLGDLAQFEAEIALDGKPLAAGVLTVARAP